MNIAKENWSLQSLMAGVVRNLRPIIRIAAVVCLLAACSDTVNKPVVSYELARPQIDTLVQAQRFEEAYALAKDVLTEAEKKFGENSKQVASLCNILGVGAFELGRTEEARQWFEKELQIRQKTNEPTDEVVLTALKNLANVEYEEGRYPEALDLVLDLKTRREQKGATKTNQYAIALSGVGKLLADMNRFVEAEPYLVDAINLFKEVSDPDIDQLIATTTYLWGVYNRLEDYDEALTIADFFVMLAGKHFGEKHRHMATALRMQGMTLLLKNDPRAEQILERSYALHQQLFPPDDIEMAITKRDMGLMYMLQGRNELADQFFREALETARKKKGEEHPDIVEYLADYGNFLVLTGKYTQASSLLHEALRISDRNFGKDSPTAKKTVEILMKLYIATGEQAQLNSAAERLRTIQENMQRR